METIAGADLSQRSFARFADYITGELGIKMPESKLTMVQSRLLRRVRELRLDSVDAYGEYFFNASNVGEREHFINAITTNKTDFFREPAHFEYLARSALPSLGRCTRRCPVWSAGCSSGEEPYTLAMVLSEYAQEHPGFDFSILATDISTKVLDQARSGIYAEPSVSPLPAELRRKYVLRNREKSKALVRIVPGLRERIRFHRLNLMDTDYGVGGMFDVIFFRNVMIYFSRETQEAVINKLCRNLNPGGYLFTGHSESLAGLDVPVLPAGPAVFRKPG